nr:MAG TPA: hypothetical protein [Bacteriophage sp.]DAO84991.1 MAG TPA: hypothetical protein [Caudoviricetes sp.]
MQRLGRPNHKSMQLKGKGKGEVTNCRSRN